MARCVCVCAVLLQCTSAYKIIIPKGISRKLFRATWLVASGGGGQVQCLHKIDLSNIRARALSDRQPEWMVARVRCQS